MKLEAKIKRQRTKISRKFSLPRRKTFFVSALLSVLIFTVLFLPFTFSANAQSGLLIPTNENKPNPKILSLAKMNIDITIDNGRAQVKLMQIFDSHAAQILEGKYVFALGQQSSISDFAVWDGDQRIPGVMMERRRANRIYDSIKQQQTDPGILQTTGDDESASGFSAKIFPINAYGTKRLEMEYTEDLAVENFTSHFMFPLKPSYGETQTIGEFNLKVRVLNDFPFVLINQENSAYPLRVTKNDPNEFVGEFHAAQINLENDFSLAYNINAPENALSIIAYRAPESVSAYDLRDPATAKKTTDGFFQAQAIFAENSNQQRSPKRIVLLLDTSLSMYGDKLVRAVEATDFFLHNFAPEDEFNLILFNDEAQILSETPIRAEPENIERALQFVKNSYLGGGTNLKFALQSALAQTAKFSNGGKREIVLISDANPTLETTHTKEIEKVFDDQNVRLLAFALGANANESLLKTLTEKTQGLYDQARETEDISLKLKLFFDKVGAPDISDLQLGTDANLYDIYASGTNSFFGSNFSFVGRYRKAQNQRFDLSADNARQKISLTQEVNLPEFDDVHSFLPRVWGRARADWLIQQMNADGEREDYIAEIVHLSEKYKFVTPYTAFIAAPRALLRPRLIQPGDPVIRVKTDASIKKVFAVLPFGETLPLKFLAAEEIWETRFLAPAWMADGTYKCRLILTDKNGFNYAEEKTFVIDSRAPRVKINSGKTLFRAGEKIHLKVSADSDVNRIVAKLYAARRVQLLWSNAEKANVGDLQIPENLASGKYILAVTAEDFAHNQTTEEIQIEIIGR